MRVYSVVVAVGVFVAGFFLPYLPDALAGWGAGGCAAVAVPVYAPDHEEPGLNGDPRRLVFERGACVGCYDPANGHWWDWNKAKGWGAELDKRNGAVVRSAPKPRKGPPIIEATMPYAGDESPEPVPNFGIDRTHPWKEGVYTLNGQEVSAHEAMHAIEGTGRPHRPVDPSPGPPSPALPDDAAKSWIVLVGGSQAERDKARTDLGEWSKTFRVKDYDEADWPLKDRTGQTVLYTKGIYVVRADSSAVKLSADLDVGALRKADPAWDPNKVFDPPKPVPVPVPIPVPVPTPDPAPAPNSITIPIGPLVVAGLVLVGVFAFLAGRKLK